MYDEIELKSPEIAGFLQRREELINQINEIDEAIEDQTGQPICEVLKSSEVQPSLHRAPFEQQ